MLARRRAAGLLGEAILGREGFDFDVAIHVGAGAYVCGEESALIESLEGKRGTPRNRPPYPVTNGYLGQPTVVNNVETFAVRPPRRARTAAPGTRASARRSPPARSSLCVSGDCARPGIYEYPFGVEVRQVLADCGARRHAGGPGERPFGRAASRRPSSAAASRFEDLPTAGALMVFDAQRDMFEVARNFVHFFAHESCGFCTPCRVGTSLLKNMMDKLANGHGSPYDFAEIERMNLLLQTMSHCGLGHSACNPVLAHASRSSARPTSGAWRTRSSSRPSTSTARSRRRAQMTGRDDAAAHVQPERRQTA